MKKYYKILIGTSDESFKPVMRAIWDSLNLKEEDCNYHMIFEGAPNNSMAVKEMSKEEGELFEKYQDRVITSGVWEAQADTFQSQESIEFANKKREAYEIFNTW